MTLQDRDKRALMLLGGAAVIAMAVYFWPVSDGSAKVVTTGNYVEAAEKRLARMRQIAATVPGKEEVNKKMLAELAAREKGMIQAETAAQAQAQLIQILRRIGQGPGSTDRSARERNRAGEKFREEYAEVSVSVNLECRIDQLVNLLADITAQPELIATSEIRIGSANGREKNVPVRLTVSGVVSKKLLPQKKGTEHVLTRKLVLLNILLLGLIVALGWFVRMKWLEEQAREKQLLSQQLKAAPAPPVTPLVTPPPRAGQQLHRCCSKDAVLERAQPECGSGRASCQSDAAAANCARRISLRRYAHRDPERKCYFSA